MGGGGGREREEDLVSVGGGLCVRGPLSMWERASDEAGALELNWGGGCGR